MQIEQFEYMLALSEERSFSAAAKRLFITQPSLSQSVKSLEQQLGVELIRRTTSEMTFTYAGEEFVETARQIIDLKNRYISKINDMNNLQTGKLTIGIPNFRGSIMLPQTLPIYHQRYPKVTLSIVEAASSSLELLTVKGQTDVSIIQLPIASKQLSYEHITTEKMLLAAPPEHPCCKDLINKPQDFSNLPTISLNELRNEAFILLKHGHRMRQTCDKAFKYANITPNNYLEVNNLLTAQRLVANNFGFTFIAETSARFSNQILSPIYFRLSDSNIQWELVAAYRSDSYLSNITRAYIDLVKEIFG